MCYWIRCWCWSHSLVCSLRLLVTIWMIVDSERTFSLFHRCHKFSFRCWVFRCYMKCSSIFSHRWMHSNMTMYAFHQQHHTTFASVGVSGQYMHWMDYVITQAFPTMLPCIILDTHICVMCLCVVIGSLNSIHSHGGYAFPFMPNPADHLAHHLYFNVAFGIGPLDWLFGTNPTSRHYSLVHKTKSNSCKGTLPTNTPNKWPSCWGWEHWSGCKGKSGKFLPALSVWPLLTYLNWFLMNLFVCVPRISSLPFKRKGKALGFHFFIPQGPIWLLELKLKRHASLSWNKASETTWTGNCSRYTERPSDPTRTEPNPIENRTRQEKTAAEKKVLSSDQKSHWAPSIS